MANPILSDYLIWKLLFKNHLKKDTGDKMNKFNKLLTVSVLGFTVFFQPGNS